MMVKNALYWTLIKYDLLRFQFLDDDRWLIFSCCFARNLIFKLNMYFLKELALVEHDLKIA
jgi:hypothetical protein